MKVKNIRKTYPGVVALDDVSFDLRIGEVHALVGENGAGKSTLIKTIAGAIAPDSGVLEIDGTEYSRMLPKLSKELGIEVIYQEFNLMQSMSVAENIFLTELRGKKTFVNAAEFVRKTKELFHEMNIRIDPKAKVSELSNSEKQLIEVVKAVSKETTKVLVLDEPTAALSLGETKILYTTMDKLKARGVSMIYISHRLDEVFEVSDRVTVLRDGKTVDTLETAKTNTATLIKLMVGRELSKDYPARTTEIGGPVLEVSGVSAKSTNNVSFTLHKGEILGLAGLVGAGRTEAMRVIFGVDKMTKGVIKINGKEVHINSPKKAMENGLSYVSEDRKQEGVLLGLDIKSNIVLPIVKKISNFGVVKSSEEERISQEYVKILNIRTPNLKQTVANLSGGNQQKVAVAKCLASGSQIIIFDEPTRGIDVGAKSEIYLLMRELSSKGISILMVSSEMDELIGMSDRVVVFRNNEVVDTLDIKDVTQEKLLMLESGTIIEESKENV